MISRKILILLLLMIPLAFAELQGTLNLTNVNNSIVSGIWGQTYYQFCNGTTCSPLDRCAMDYDGTGYSTTYQGWCINASETRCAHSDTASSSPSFYDNATNKCKSDTYVMQCVSGSWNDYVTCNSTQYCSVGACIALITTTTTASGSSGTTATTANTTTSITSSTTTTIALGQQLNSSVMIRKPQNITILQGSSSVVQITVLNTGNFTLYNLTLALSGLPYPYNITPSKVTSLAPTVSGVFQINISLSSSSIVNVYTLNLALSTSNSSVSTSESFMFSISPNNDTINNNILPLYSRYSLHLAGIEKNITLLSSSGADVSIVNNTLARIKLKLEQASTEISAGNYVTANSILGDVGSAINDLSSQVEKVPAPLPSYIIIIAVAGIIVVVSFIAYTMWPTRPAGYTEKGWNHPPNKKSFFSKLKSKPKKKEEKDDYKYNYGQKDEEKK